MARSNKLWLRNAANKVVVQISRWTYGHRLQDKIYFYDFKHIFVLYMIYEKIKQPAIFILFCIIIIFAASINKPAKFYQFTVQSKNSLHKSKFYF